MIQHVGDALGTLEGLVLCHAQGERLAIPAAEVDGFDHATPSMPYAGHGFQADSHAPEGAKALRCGTSSLAVDTVEVFTQPVKRLAVPEAITRAWGGALVCFVECEGALWPVVSLLSLSRREEAQ